MWDQYRRTFLPMQIFIVGACAAMMYFLHVPVRGVAVPFAVMEIGAIYGARWAVRLKGDPRRSKTVNPMLQPPR